MKIRSRLALIILPTVLAAAPAQAQKTYAIGLGGGTAIPVGRLNNTQKAGYNALVVLAIGVGDLPLGLRLDGIFNQFSRRNQAGTAGANPFRVTGGIANLVYAFPGTTAKPYILAGLGYYATKAITPGSTTDNDWGANGGVGATFAVGPFASFVESRYHFISRKPARGGVIHFVPVTIGLLF